MLTLLLRMQARLQTAEEGQGMVEYALILALVSVVAIVILMGLGTQVTAVFSSASSSLGAAV
jgi:pilus assembly protein Flp/PilA